MNVIRPTGLSYRDCLNDLCSDLRSRRLTPLLGAGISRSWPSCLPLAVDLQAPLIKLLYQAVAAPLARFPPDSIEHQAIETQINEARLERLLDAFHRVYGDPAMDWLSVLASENCNSNHLALAVLVAGGFLPHIITLNFDLLIERAIEQKQLTFRTACTLHPARFPTGNHPVDCFITKPHGSLWPDPENRFRYLGATLSQIGNHVARQTRETLQNIFRRHPTLLVAGYSDNDWDIMPALVQPGMGVQRVIWIQHSANNPLPPKAVAWLDRLGANGVALQGDILKLLTDCIQMLGCEKPAAPVEHHPPYVRDAETLFSDKRRNMLVFAQLLHDDALKQHFLESIGELREQPELEILRLRGLGAVAHTGRDVKRAVRLNALALKLQQQAQCDGDELPDRLIWIGYEHLCLAKRPSWREPLELVSWPWYVARGLWLLARGTRASPPNSKQRLLALAAYYRTDLIHSWTNALIALGPSVTGLFGWLFRILVKRYERVELLHPDLMEWEYYWLRKLEVQLLGGIPVPYAETRAQIDEILESYQLVQNSVQLGNPHVFRALLDYVHERPLSDVRLHLDEAEKVWRAPGNYTPSGLQRVATYRRFFGLPPTA